MAASGAVASMIGQRYPRGRAVAFVGLGVAGFVAIAASVPDNSLPTALFWIGWPSLTLVKVWSKQLRRASGRPSGMHRAI